MKIKNLIFLIILFVALSVLIILLFYNKSEIIQNIDFDQLINNGQLEINIYEECYCYFRDQGLSFDQFLLDKEYSRYHFNSNELKGVGVKDILDQFNEISLEKFKLNLNDLSHSPLHKFRKTILGFSIPLNPFLFYPLYKNKYENAWIYLEFLQDSKVFYTIKVNEFYWIEINDKKYNWNFDLISLIFKLLELKRNN